MLGQIDKAGLLITAIVGLLGMLPAVAVISGLVPIPPGIENLVKSLAVPVGIVMVLSVIACSGGIRRLTAKTAVLIFGLCTLLGATATVGQFMFAGGHVVQVSEEQRYVLPISPSPLALEIVGIYDGDYKEALRNSSRRDLLKAELDRDDGSAVLVMILLILAAHLLLTLAIVGSLWKTVLSRD